jgi:hypothetical protein
VALIALRLSANKPPQPNSEVAAMNEPFDPEAVRRFRVRQLFTVRNPENAAEEDVFLFF